MHHSEHPFPYGSGNRLSAVMPPIEGLLLSVATFPTTPHHLGHHLFLLADPFGNGVCDPSLGKITQPLQALSAKPDRWIWQWLNLTESMILSNKLDCLPITLLDPGVRLM